jgi:hypothetical protein
MLRSRNVVLEVRALARLQADAWWPGVTRYRVALVLGRALVVWGAGPATLAASSLPSLTTREIAGTP